MKRRIEPHLLDWKASTERKVLLLRGARQVGKTYSIRKLGKTFPHFLEVNFEEDEQIAIFFRGSLNPDALCEKLSAYYAVPIIPGQTLLFFDEIQACPNALRALRFFHEKKSELHVAAAGSLLEFALSEIPSFGVGRITSLFLYPLSFAEFLEANGMTQLVPLIQQASPKNPIDNVLHKKIINQFKTYQLVGGMPEVVNTYVQHHDLSLCQKTLNDLILSFQDDFAKYKKRASIAQLNEVFQSIAFQAGKKFKYSNIDSQASHQPLKDALAMLIQAGLAYKVLHTAARGLPLGAQVNQKRFKVILFDVGIHQRLLGLEIGPYLVSDDFSLINKGHMAEVSVGLDLITASKMNTRPQLYYWHREARSSNAEVDYIIAKGENIIPLEVKAGIKGQMQSINIFMNERLLITGVRLSLENFDIQNGILTVPIYAAGAFYI